MENLQSEVLEKVLALDIIRTRDLLFPVQGMISGVAALHWVCGKTSGKRQVHLYGFFKRSSTFGSE